MATFQLTEEEYVAGALGSMRRLFTRVLIVMPLAIALITCSMFLQKYGWGAVLIGAVVGIALSTTFFFLLPRLTRKTFHQHTLLRETFHLTFSEAGIEYVHDSGRYSYKWEQTRYWNEDSRFIYLFESQAVVRMLPKRVLSKEEESLIRSRLASVPKK